MKTAVVILNWNGANLLGQFLPSVIAATNRDVAEVIVADNGSTDSSRDILKNEFPEIRTILFEKNYGFAGGYNRVVEQLKDEFDYVVLLNSDVAPRSGWIEPLVNFMDNNPRVGACQPKVLSYTQPEQFEYAGASGGFIDKNGYPYCRGRIFSKCERDTGQYDDIMPVFWATGAALMVRTGLYLEVGGLDEDFFAHFEEIDLCWRIQLAGKQIYVVPDSVVFHLGGGSLDALNPRKTYLNFRNNLLMMHKNLPDGVRRGKLFRRRMYDTIAWVKFIATFKFRHAAAVLRAHKDFRRMARNYTTHPDTNLLDMFPGANVNILTSFYLRRRTSFGSLPIAGCCKESSNKV